MPQISTSTLIAQLATQDIRHLHAAKVADVQSDLNIETLIANLAQHPSPRLREALILLFLRQPDHAKYVPSIVASLPADAKLTLQHMYTVAVYLQRLWYSTLSLYLGKFALLPDYYGQNEFGLPSPDVYWGEAGLRALAALFQEKTGYDWLTAYHTAISLLLAQLSLEARIND